MRPQPVASTPHKLRWRLRNSSGDSARCGYDGSRNFTYGPFFLNKFYLIFVERGWLLLTGGTANGSAYLSLSFSSSDMASSRAKITDWSRQMDKHQIARERTTKNG